MGIGDWIMATAQARKAQEIDPRPVIFSNGMKYKWSDVFENNFRIVKRFEPGRTQVIMNGPGLRPYIARKAYDRWVWKQWDIQPGELYMSETERAFGLANAGNVIIEPNTKQLNSNKSWPFVRWQQVVDALPQVPWLQVGDTTARVLQGVPYVQTTFRQAAAVMAHSKLFVGCEGALHHTAAVFHTPAVVLWSEFIAPEFTGYHYQTNIRHAERWCGIRLPCNSCRQAMLAITVEEVVEAIRKELA